jgi:hypothetical protein
MTYVIAMFTKKRIKLTNLFTELAYSLVPHSGFLVCVVDTIIFLVVTLFTRSMYSTKINMLIGSSTFRNLSMFIAIIVDGFRVARTRGTTRQTQRFERRGLNVGDLGSQRNTVMEVSSRRPHNTLQRGTPIFTQVQGPRGEVKHLLPTFLYYDATPREEYKVLVTKI